MGFLFFSLRDKVLFCLGFRGWVGSELQRVNNKFAKYKFFVEIAVGVSIKEDTVFFSLNGSLKCL